MSATRPTLQTADGSALTVAPDAGGRIASLRIAGAERLLTRPGAAPRLDWGCYLMAPWVGRLAHALLPTEGAVHELAANHGPHAIHGVALDADWRVLNSSVDHVRLSAGLGQAGWPVDAEVVEEIALAPGCARLSAMVTAGESAMPAALGWHPWFARPATGDLALRCRAERVLITDDELIPDGSTAAAEGPLDLRSGEPLGQRRLDHCYIDVREPVVLSWPDLQLTIEAGASTYVVHTPERGVCVEPQTAWPNAPALAAAGHPGTGLTHLAPGESLGMTAALTWARVEDDA